MNTNTIGIGLLAGCATTLLCLGVLAGSGLSVVLYFLSAVPLMVATLGWGFAAGVAGAAVAQSDASAVVRWSCDITVLYPPPPAFPILHTGRREGWLSATHLILSRLK